ncbi:MobF family relaxase [Nocardia terpenica]|nr:MobF family relaxase [Nocardia terpenica]
MTIHALHGGDGYEYLTRQVATADRERARGQGLTDYYNEHGTPPGRWAGRGAELMGVSGAVTEGQMRALYGEGLHPDADKIIADAIENGASAEAAMKEAKLGSGLYAFKGGVTEIQSIYERRKAEFVTAEKRSPTRDEWLELRTDAGREHLANELGRKPSRDEIAKALNDEKRKARQAVVGWDCVFTPQKSVSILWGLGDDELRRAIWECHEEAMRDVLTRMEDNYALARRGRGGTRLIDAEGLTFAQYQHYDNRTGDMNPHTHVVVSSRVLGSDGKWSSLRADALIQATVSLSCQYNAALTGKLKRKLGLRFEERTKGRGKEPVLEVVGVSDEMIKHFSRRADIMARTEELVKQYRETHGRDPSKATQIKLAQQATLDTREDKPLPKTLREMIGEWDERARQFLGDGRTAEQFVDDILYLSHNPDAARPYEAARIATEVGLELGGKAAVLAADESELTGAIERALDGCTFGPQTTRAAAADEVRTLLSPGHEDHLLDELTEAIAARERTEYDPQRIAEEVTEKVSRRRATWAETHIRAAVEDRLAVCDFATDDDHRAAVEQIVSAVRDQHSVLLTVDPDVVPQALARRNGESVFNAPASTSVRYSSEAVLAAEERLQTAAQDPTAEFLTRSAVAKAIAQVEEESRGRTLGRRRGKPRRLKAGQRRIVEHFCTSGARLAVAVGPAGTGKTTALRAVVRAWQNDGRTVVALSQQMSAARVLGEEIGVPARTIDSLITRARSGVDVGLARGTMILVDEAGMASTHNLDELQRIADEHGAVVRWIGDPAQLSAVESGGALRLLAADTKAPELTEVVRFANPEEAAATLDVRSGDAERAWEFYKNNDRVTSGMVDELREKILAAHLADTAAGKSSLMMAATVADVYALNGAAQAAHALRGTVKSDGPHAGLADGHKGYIGDILVTRKNNHRLRITGGSRARTPVDNGDLWRVNAVHQDGSLTVVGTTHRGRVTLPARYVRDHTELGYASTVHRAQGMTVKRAHLLMNATLGRALAYVGLSRGQEFNGIYVATDALPDPALDHAPDEPAAEHDVFMRVLAREDDNLTATEVMRAEQARISDPARTREMYDYATELLGRARAEYLLDRSLPVVLYTEARRSERYEELLDTITVADALGMDSAALVADIATHGGEDLGDSLINARDAAAVLRARADHLIGDYVQSTTVPPAAAAAVETLAYSPTSDTDALTTATAALSGEEVLSTTRRAGRFVALRDAELPAVPPVPSRYPGMDLELAEFAEGLRARLLGTGAERLADNRPTVPVTAEEKEAVLDSYAEAANPVERRAKIQRDYEYYVRELGHERGRWLLDRAFPIALVRQIERGRGYPALLDTIALADAHGLDTNALMGSLIDGTDHGRTLITARDAAAVLRARADRWIAEHAITSVAPTATASLVTLGYDDQGHAAELTDLTVAVNTGTDVLAAQPRPARWRALDDLAPPRGLRPIPPEFPGMDMAMADYADELRRLLLELPDDAADWRARAAQTAAVTERGEEADDDLEREFEPEFHAAAPETGFDTDRAAEEPEPEDEWAEFTAAGARPIELPYPELSRTERAMRIHAELTAARERVGRLFEQAMWRTHPHQLAIEPKIAEMRLRMDALRPLVLAVRDVQQQWEEAEFDAITAEDAYQTALHAHPEAADEEFIASVEEQIDALDDDPALRARLAEQLELYRTAAAEAAAGAVAAEIARTKQDAAAARAYADELREQIQAAQEALDAAAGGEPVPTEDEVHTWRGVADDLVHAELNAARAEAQRLEMLSFHATHQAANELQADTGVSHSQAVWELENRYQEAAAARAAAGTTVADEGEPEIGPESPRSPVEEAEQAVEAEADQDAAPAVDEAPADPAAAREQLMLEQMQAEPIRMRSDTELDLLIRTLRRTASRRDDPTAWQGFHAAQSRVEQVRADHARLAEQVEAIEAAQAAESVADQAADAAAQASAATRDARQTLAGISALRPGARREAQQLVEQRAAAEQRTQDAVEVARAAARVAAAAARDAGAPQPQWAALLARAADRATLAAEMEAAERDDARDEEIRERAAQRAARAARDLETALAERDRRTALSPVDAAAEHRIRAAHAPATGPRSAGPTAEQQAAAQAEAERHRQHDHGPEL